ncbi:uncharacterized protein LOC120480352 isoform X2 [Pimephales promelas]|uniref:uncharacterized protein LOC120480352 isoform X2 n=1 Tax=Pimephales promelas TaxID=90988 RepID=UPI0019556093|nr:uncharacterized protein LOC120480352 isoform X2 [Pimephales promelas]KAG1949969.1 hypothetical protein F2P79_011642 [Pimephales promelas]
MALFILITFQLLLQVKSQGLPQANLTIFPTFATNGEKVQMLCGGHENQHVSECMFYPAGQENYKIPSALCNITLTSIKLIMWSQDPESSHVNISCYYTVYGIGDNTTSPHSDKVSVKVRGLAAMSSLSPITEDSPTTLISNGNSEGDSTTSPHSDKVSVKVRGLAAMSSLSPITEDSPTTLISNGNSEGLVSTSSLSPITVHDSPTLISSGNSEANLSNASTTDTTSLVVTPSTEITTDPITNMSHDSSLTVPANASLESTSLAETTEPASVEILEINSNIKMFFSIAVVATAGGIVLTGLMGIGLYGCTRRPKDERIWIEKKSKKQGVTLPITGSDSSGEEKNALYSTVNSAESTAQPPAGNSEESKQTEVELNHLYVTIVTQPSVVSDSNDVYSLLTAL